MINNYSTIDSDIESQVANEIFWDFPQQILPERRLLLNLAAYFDESGTHEGSDYVAVAGFVGIASDWVEFSAQWQLALNDFGLSHFHMADFANRVKPYDSWSEDMRRIRLARLLNIIKDNVIGSVGISVPKKYCDDILSKRAKKVCGGAYGLAAMGCFMDLGEVLRTIKFDGKVAYVFEGGSQGAPQILRVFQSNLKDPEQREHLRLLSLHFADKRDFLPLQAADILAYEIYKESYRKGQLNTPRYPLSTLADLPKKWGRLDEDGVRDFAKVIYVRVAMEDTGEVPPL